MKKSICFPCLIKSKIRLIWKIIWFQQFFWPHITIHFSEKKKVIRSQWITIFIKWKTWVTKLFSHCGNKSMRNYEKITLGTSDAWLMSCSPNRPRDQANYIEDCRIFVVKYTVFDWVTDRLALRLIWSKCCLITFVSHGWVTDLLCRFVTAFHCRSELQFFSLTSTDDTINLRHDGD